MREIFPYSKVFIFAPHTLTLTPIIGCGLPAGPGGLIGGIEGISYLGVAGLLGASAYKKSTTGSGLPAGPFALLGAAEGVAFLLLLAGVYVGVCQVLDYGYIPNAVPVEGGKCA